MATSTPSSDMKAYMADWPPEKVRGVLALVNRFRLIQQSEPSLTHEEYLHRLEWLLANHHRQAPIHYLVDAL